MKLVKGTDAIKKAIVSIKTRGAKLDKDIHIAGCSCLQHIEEHGDITLLNTLVDAMPKGSRVNALREWAEVHGKVKYNNETTSFEYAKTSTTLMDEAMACSWVEFKPESVYTAMDFQAEMNKIFKKAYDRVGKDLGDNVDPALLNKMASAFGYVKA